MVVYHGWFPCVVFKHPMPLFMPFCLSFQMVRSQKQIRTATLLTLSFSVFNLLLQQFCTIVFSELTITMPSLKIFYPLHQSTYQSFQGFVNPVLNLIFEGAKSRTILIYSFFYKSQTVNWHIFRNKKIFK